MSIRPLQPRQQQDVINTLERATELSSECNPSEAIAKAAMENRMPRNMLQYLVNAYNNGVSQVPIKSGKTREERATTVPLATVEEVEHHLYGDTVNKQANAVSRDYSVLPSVLLRSAEPAVVKKASVVTPREALPVVAKSAGIPGDTPTLGLIEDVKRAMATVRSLVNAEFLYYKRAQAEIQTYLNNHLHLAKDELVDQSVAAFGKLAQVVIEPLADDQIALKKRGKAQVVRIDRAPFSLVKKAILHLEKLDKLASDNQEYVQKVAARLKEARTGDADADRMLASIERQLGLAENTQPKVTPVDKRAYARGLDLLKVADMAPAQTPVPMPSTPAAPMSVSKPVLSANDLHEINSIHSASSLNNLLMSNPDLANYPPDAVARAFNEIRTAYPSVANNPVAMRPFLQRHLAAGGLDEYSGKNLADQAAKFQQSRNPSAGGMQ